ncbi:MAG: hypothetical protein JOZ25_10840 [Actinobacteria bacterium]|nr:hypothetical protein [Actinomycetota bacterium]
MTWQLASLLVVGLALAGGFAWYERKRPSSRVIALVATLVAMAVLGRLAFAPIPNVKPATTDVILFAGLVLGAAPGFVTGAMAALVSNFFISQGSWTPWQMAAWGIVGLLGAALGRAAVGRELGRWPLACACALAGLVFGAVMNTYQWTLAATQDMATWIAISGQSLPFDLAHAIGNFLFCLALGPAFVRAIARYRRRFDVTWRPPVAVAPATIVGAALATLAVLAAPPRAEASSADRAAGYLLGAQNSDGGFGAAPGSPSSSLYTGWAGLGLAAAGRDPAAVRRSGPSLIDYARASVAGTSDTGELERTILLLRAAGLPATDSTGRDLVGALLAHRGGDGSFDESINWTAFGVFAMRAAGSGSTQGSAGWLAAQQNGDGGWGPDPHVASDVDDTGAVLEALAAAGAGSGAAVDRAVSFIARSQNGDGGMGEYPGYGSNAQSTSWAIQGLVAVGRDPGSITRGGRTPLAYIESLQNGDGSIRYSSSSSQTPVWVTAQAITALERRPFPLMPGGSAGSATAGGSAGGGSGAGAGAASPGGSGVGGMPGRGPSRGARGGATSDGRTGAGRPSLTRASQRVGGGEALPPASVGLLAAGGVLLLTGLLGLWRAQRRTGTLGPAASGAAGAL